MRLKQFWYRDYFCFSHHRRKNPETGNLDPVSEYAKFCDKVDHHVLELIKELNPKFFFIENPRGGLRKMTWMQGLPRHTITYCQYELDKPVNERRMKPTDIWTNHPNPQFRPMCKNGDSCHAAAPRGAKTGTQGLKGARERSVIPRMLCEHIVYICEKAVLWMFYTNDPLRDFERYDAEQADREARFPNISIICAAVTVRMSA